MNNENSKKSITKILVVIGLVVLALVFWFIMPKDSSIVVPENTTGEQVSVTEDGSVAPGTTTANIPGKTKPVVKGGITPSPTPVVGGKTYTNEQFGLMLSYPKEFTVLNEEQSKDLPWRYNSAFPGRRIFTLTLPKTFQPNTNFSEALVTVGISMDPTGVNGCLQTENGEINRSSGTPFSRFTLSDAGAGNYYETTSYRTLKNGACLSIETVIHSTSLAAYPASSGIKEFNKATVQQKLNQVINSVDLI